MTAITKKSRLISMSLSIISVALVVAVFILRPISNGVLDYGVVVSLVILGLFSLYAIFQKKLPSYFLTFLVVSNVCLFLLLFIYIINSLGLLSKSTDTQMLVALTLFGLPALGVTAIVLLANKFRQ